jgi:DNA-binding beta-propeller fold protein YncE
MPFVPVGVPEPLRIAGPFAALTIDAVRRRVFAAGVRTLAIVDADTGKLVATIRLGGVLSLAVEPLGGHVFAGTGDGRISEVDPDRKVVVRSLAGNGPVDLLLYDSATGRLYAGGAGASLLTIDARTFVPVGSLALPGAAPAGAAADPITSELYVGFAGLAEIAIVDPHRGAVRTTFPTAGGQTAAVRFDDAFGEIVVAATGGDVAVYDRAGTPEGSVAIPGGIVACDLDTGDHLLACTGSGGLTFVQLQRDAAPRIAGHVDETGTARVVLDEQTHEALAVAANTGASGSAVRKFEPAPAASSP